MAKLYIQSLPNEEELKQSVIALNPNADATILYSNLLFMKVAAEIESNLDALLSKYSLSSGRFMLLFVLRNAPEGMRPSELSQAVGVTQATISGLINNLEKSELILRETHQSDGRSFVIKLSQKGQDLIQEIFPQWYPKLSAFWSVVGESEKSDLNNVLQKMIQNSAALIVR